MNRKIVVAALVLPVLLGASSCDGSADKQDKRDTNEQAEVYQNNQPLHKYDWSQYRDTVQAVQDAQAYGYVTTTFVMHAGGSDPIASCPSIGFPIAATTQLTNPWKNDGNGAVIGLMEPTGVFPGDSAGTYVVCLDSSGKPYVNYFEDEVASIGGPAHWDYDKHVAVLDGEPTAIIKSTK